MLPLELPTQSLYAQSHPLQIRGLKTHQREIRRHEILEVDIDLAATYQNPFDSSQIAVDARLTGPSGRTLTLPAFLYRPYDRKLENGKEVAIEKGPPTWKVRVTPLETGPHSLTVTAKDRTGKKTSHLNLDVKESKSPGFIRVSPKDRRFFAFDSGAPYFPVGLNTCWGNDPGTFSFDKWMPQYGANGVNYGRLWMGPSWSTFALETPGAAVEGKGFGQFNLFNAWRIDHVLGLAREHGLYLMLCLDSYNMLRDKDGYPDWELTPYNIKNGGPLAHPKEFWTNLQVQRQYRDRLRYAVARWGADPHVMSWEFWNEVDLTRDFDTEVGKDWHRRMASHLRAIDPYDHLLTTSFSDSNGRPGIDGLEELDFVQTHLYSANFVNDVSARVAKGERKPHFVGEVGADWRGPRQEDKDGLQVHDALWVGISSGMAGTAMTWWWDNLVEPNGLYPLFRPAADFVKGIDWPKEEIRPAQVSVVTALEVSAVQGKGTAIAWVRVAGRSWGNVIENKTIPPAAPPSTLRWRDLPPGTWHAEVWDTWKGGILSRQRVGPHGEIALPAIDRDVAVKLVRSGRA